MDFGSPRRVTVGGTGWKKTYTIQAQFRAEQFEKVLRYTTQNQCRMAALVLHFGDVEDASRACGVCDVCDPAGAVLRLFRRATAVERAMAQAIVDDLRPLSYRGAGSLQRSLELVGRLSRNDFDALLGAMAQAGLIEIEEAEYEKDGEVKRFRKVMLTEAGRDLRPEAPIELLLSDGIVEEFGGRVEPPVRKKKPKAVAGAATGKRAEPGLPKAAGKAEVPAPPVTPEVQALAVRIREWRAEEAKRLRVPAYVVLHDRTLTAVAQARPRNPRQLMEVDGMGPAKVERFGEAILWLCAGE
jgi:superfamily II DNA helicase RecQ